MLILDVGFTRLDVMNMKYDKTNNLNSYKLTTLNYESKQT